jgi:hypothetical protein
VVIKLTSLTELLAAVAAAWLVAGRTFLTLLEDSRRAHAAKVQELYDTELFGLEWNAALVGRRPVPEDIADAAGHVKDRAPYLDWYSVEVTGLTIPKDVLLCQRQSAIWARHDQRAYAWFLLTVGVGWLLAGLGLALARNMTLGEYLVKLFLPSSPAYLDAIELARAHWRHGNARQRLEDDIEDLWQRQQDGGAVTQEDCRRVQDSAFVLRRSGPPVATWFYKWRRGRMNRATVAGAKALRESAGD